MEYRGSDQERDERFFAVLGAELRERRELCQVGLALVRRTRFSVVRPRREAAASLRKKSSR
jgi:hypothetical protein